MRDDNFQTNSAIVNLYPSEGTQWVGYVDKYYFDSYGCAPPKKKHKK